MSKGIQIIEPEERFVLALDGAELHMRRLDSEELVAIERRLGPAAGRAELNREVLDYVLVDWKGVTSPLGGVEVPCTRENKQRLPAAVKARVLAASQWARAEAPEEQGPGPRG